MGFSHWTYLRPCCHRPYCVIKYPCQRSRTVWGFALLFAKRKYNSVPRCTSMIWLRGFFFIFYVFLGFQVKCTDTGPAENQLWQVVGKQKVYGSKLRNRFTGRIRRASALRQVHERHWWCQGPRELCVQLGTNTPKYHLKRVQKFHINWLNITIDRQYT